MNIRIIFLLCILLASVTTFAQNNNKKDKKPKKPWYEAAQPNFAKSQLGRVYANTLDFRDSDVATVEKPQIIRLGDDHDVTVVFDTERLMMVAAIPARFAMFNTYRNGLGGSGNWIGPPYLFTAPKGSNDGQYKGLYQHDQKVILSYSVGTLPILELPHVNSRTKNIITRYFEFGPSQIDQEIVIGPAENAIQLLPRHASVTLSVKDDMHVLTVKAGPGERLATVHFFQDKVHEVDQKDFLQPSHFTRGGSRQWPETITTKGELGKAKDGFAVDTITPPFDNPYGALLFFGGHDFFSNGDAAICTMHGDVWRVSGIDDDLDELTWTRFATGMFHPLGLRVVDDHVYVTCRDQLTKLHDFNKDGAADFYEAYNHEIEIGKHVHEYATGLDTDPEGNFYFVKGNNQRQSKHDGSLIRISKDGKTFEQFATGFRWPNGSGVGPDGTITVADQQGTWVPSSKIDIVKRGGFYGYMSAHHREVEPTKADPPLCWIPHKVDNSCGGQTWVPKGVWGPLEGKMVHLSYGKCQAFLVLQENVNGIEQGGVVKLPVHFQSGAMRARFNPHDQHLYVSGLKGWQTSGAKDGCFQRIRMTKPTTTLPTGLHVHENGILVRFEQELDRELAEDPSSWSIHRWNYRWTKGYGSKDYKVSNPEEIGRDAMSVQSAKLSKDGMSVFLTVADLKPVMQMAINYDLENTDGDVMINGIYHTVHELRAKR